MKSTTFDVKVLANKKISPQHYILECELPEELPSAPGQFLELYLDREKQFLRRPFSIFEYNNNVIKILYKIKGQVTSYLAQLKKGASINIIYPLGNSFLQPETRKVIFVSGGTGFAPLHFLAKKLWSEKKYDIEFFIGGQGKEVQIFENFIKQLNIKTSLATEDGSAGRKGFVTLLLDEIKNFNDCCIYSAGPLQMLKNIFTFTKKNNIKSYFSLESHFACGLGMCWGCVIETTKGFLRICREGPVFEGDVILWEKIK